MGTFVNVVKDGVKKYIGLTEKPFSKVLSMTLPMQFWLYSISASPVFRLLYEFHFICVLRFGKAFP